MKRAMSVISIVSVIGTVLCVCLYQTWENEAVFATAITFGTVAYHFIMRLGVGHIFNLVMRNKADYKKGWYQTRTWEKKLYGRIKVKRWKGLMPTYTPYLFNPTKNRWDEIAQASCQAELVHETIIVLSFVPIFFSIWFGATIIFIITSVLAALFDLAFVMIQRYNRPRILLINQKAWK